MKRWLGASLLVVLLGAGAWGWRSYSSGKTPKAAADPRANRPVPVVMATVARQDVPIYLDGLGTVVAYKTVTVKPQVDGRLDQVLFQEGQPVKKGQVLAQIDPRPFRIQLHQAEGALARDRAQLANARLTQERNRKLIEGKLIAQQQVDDQGALIGQLEGAVRVDEAAVESARLNLDYARITSPVDGVTGVRLVDPGNVVRAADPSGIVVVTQLDPIAVLVTLPQDELPRLASEMAKGKLTVQAYSRDGATLLGTGQLELIDNQINQQTATLRLKAILPNPQRLLWPNQFVKARLLLTTRRGALVVPATTLQRGPNGTFAYVIAPDQTVSPRPITASPPIGEIVMIEHGLTEGEQVVADGQNLLRPGSRVIGRTPGQADADRSGGRPGGKGPGGKGPGGKTLDGKRPPGGKGPGAGAASPGR